MLKRGNVDVDKDVWKVLHKVKTLRRAILLRLFDIVASVWHGEGHPSVFQARERDDFYSIGTGIGHVATCKDVSIR